MTSWIKQTDGTFLPSAELMERVRSNPQQYPDAAADFAQITGKSVEEVQAIIDNPGSSGFFGTITGTATDVGQGAINATATLAENLLPESILGEGGQAMRDFSQSLDPKFDTEKGVVETIAEGAGQALPAIAATIGTGGWGGILVGAGVSTLTWEDEDNLANALNEVAPDFVPEMLVVQPEDDEATRTAKAFVVNAVTDAAFLGTFNIAGKAIRAFKRGAPVEELAAIAKEADGAIADNALSAAEIETVSKSAARKRLASQVELREKTGVSVLPDKVDPTHRKAFHDRVFTAFSHLSGRAEDVAKGASEFRTARKADLAVYTDNVIDALAKGDNQKLLTVLRQGVKSNNSVEAAYINTFQNSVLKETLSEVSSTFDETVRLIRENPAITTRAAFRETMSEYSDTVGEIGEIYRLYGSSASYQLLDRKGLTPKGGFEEVLQAEKWAKETYKDLGFDLFSDKIEFVTANALKMDEMGIDVTKILPELDTMFTKFDVERQGILANLKQNSVVKMSAEQRTAATASFIRMVKDIQSAALLGQLSTTGLEVVSNTINNIMLPFLEHGLAKGNFKRAGAEYAGYASAFKTASSIAKKAYLKGKGVMDDFDIMEGAHSSRLDYDVLAGQPMKVLMVRMFKFASELALASSEFWKSTRAFGLAYADSLELAMKAGHGRVAAKQIVRKYAQEQFDESGRLMNAMYRNDVSRTSWQQALDTRYATGKLAQAVDNVRNRDDIPGLLARSAVPFFKTLVNIGSDAMHYIVPPGLPAALRVMSKTKKGGWLERFPRTLKALDDFTGANGVAAQNRAIGRHRLGMAGAMSVYGAVQLNEDIEITGASGLKRWDAKKRAFEEYPPNSIVIGGVATDLNRLLPFSAPLMLVGMMRDMEIETDLQMKGGNFSADNSVFEDLANYGPALAYTSLTLFQDSAAMQGVFDLFTATDEAIFEKNPDALIRYAKRYTQQFTPGPVKMIAKNVNTDQYEGYDFYSAYLAAAGFPTGYKRLNFLGQPIVHGFGRGLDPLNMKQLHTDSPVHREFVFLNKSSELALVPPLPDAVFGKAFWKSLGVDTGGILTKGKMPSLVDLKTTSAKNGWEAYRELLYQGRLSKDELVSTGSYGDRIDIGKVLIKEGENFEDAIKRLVDDPSYSRLTPDARAKVWNATFGYFKKQAKDQLEEDLVVHPEVFRGSRYGSPLAAPASIAAIEKAGKALGASIQQTKGSPLDAVFAIR